MITSKQRDWIIGELYGGLKHWGMPKLKIEGVLDILKPILTVNTEAEEECRYLMDNGACGKHPYFDQCRLGKDSCKYYTAHTEPDKIENSTIDHEKLLLSRSIDSPISALCLFYKEVDPEYKSPILYCFLNSFVQWWTTKKEDLQEEK